VLVIYFLILKMGLSKNAAFLGASLVLFDNALLVQSKFILVDIFLLFFGFLSLYFLFCYKSAETQNKKIIFLTLAAASSGLSFSVKWTGISFFALIFLYVLIESFKGFDFKKFIQKMVILIVFPFLIYASFFWIHFSILQKSGTGDAFMSQNFQGTLQNNNLYGQTQPLSFWQKFIELNQKMYFYNSGIRATHPYSSKWYQWPQDKRPIWYWTESLAGKTANIWLFGNPLVWWPAFFAIIFSVVILFFKDLRKKLPPFFWLLVFGYFLNLLPFILIQRPAFLYHYFSALIFGILILAFLYDKLLKPSKTNSILYWSYFGAVILVFLLLSPITYGFLISPQTNSHYDILLKFFL